MPKSKYAQKKEAQAAAVTAEPVVVVESLPEPPVTARLAALKSRFQPLLEKGNELAALRAQAREIMSISSDLMAEVEQADLKALEARDLELLKEIDAEKVRQENRYYNDPEVKKILDRAWRDNQLNEVETAIRAEARAEALEICANALAEHQNLMGVIAGLKWLVTVADEHGDAARDLFEQAKALEVKEVVLAVA